MKEYGMIQRPRRLRGHQVIRELVRETHLRVDQLILPVFVVEGSQQKQPIDSMPGVFRYSVDVLVEHVQEWMALGIRAYMVFGVVDASFKDAQASQAYASQGIVQQALRALRLHCPEAYLFSDVCLCEYTDHGHCGIVSGDQILNDPTLDLLARTALSHVQAGAHCVAPSDMMDGRVGAIRERLDAEGYSDIPILAYSVKYASAYYGPFRDAAGSAPGFGDRQTYQMDPANVREGLREATLDEAEGADMIMVKPALAYLDVLHQVAQHTHLPVVAYNVSGEYAMVKAAAQNGWIHEQKVVLETLTGMVRAGAHMILSYHTIDVARWLS